jgi:hypothetical protein
MIFVPPAVWNVSLAVAAAKQLFWWEKWGRTDETINTYNLAG